MGMRAAKNARVAKCFPNCYGMKTAAFAGYFWPPTQQLPLVATEAEVAPKLTPRLLMIAGSDCTAPWLHSPRGLRH